MLQEEGFDDFDIQDAFGTLMRAEEIQKDSKLMDHVRKLMFERQDEMDKVKERFGISGEHSFNSIHEPLMSTFKLG